MLSVHKNLSNLKVFLAPDYSQIEVRMLAEISGDKLLISQFKLGKDIHCLVGNSLTGWSFERIKTEPGLRRMVKGMHFAIIFGVRRDNLYPQVVAKIRETDGENADLTGITPERLGSLFDKYFITYKGVARLIDRLRHQVERDHCVETLFGFRREIREDDETRLTYWGNQAINTPIQGTAHQFILIVLALLNLKQQTYKLLQDCIAEVHDALYFRVRLGDLLKAYHLIKVLMEEGTVEYAKRYFKLDLQVPLIAEAKAGFCMGSMVDYEGESVDEFLTKWRAEQAEVENTPWESLLPTSFTA